MTPAAILDSTRYRALILAGQDRCILLRGSSQGLRLPAISIPPHQRVIACIVETLKAKYGICCIVLDVLAEAEDSLVVAELLHLANEHEVEVGDVPVDELSHEQRDKILTMLCGDQSTDRPFSRIGWIDEAISWVEESTGHRVTAKRDVCHVHGYGSFALLKFFLVGRSPVWMKATGFPNEHERSITRLLAELPGVADDTCSYVPRVIAESDRWNAWLMDGGALPVSELPTTLAGAAPLMLGVVTSLARLQIASLDLVPSLLRAGAVDHSWQAWMLGAPEVFETVLEVMALQTSTRVPPLSAPQITKLQDAFLRVCERPEWMQVPTAILHGDLNVGNIVVREQSQFIDWSEAYVGFPGVSLAHLLLLNEVSDANEHEELEQHLTRRYLEEWERNSPAPRKVMEQGLLYAPFVAAFSALYGRANASERISTSTRSQALARTLARHMDRAARQLPEGASL